MPVHVPQAGSLIVEPGAGFSPVYDLIGQAKHRIDVTMYEFSDTTAEQDLAAAANDGTKAVILTSSPPEGGGFRLLTSG